MGSEAGTGEVAEGDEGDEECADHAPTSAEPSRSPRAASASSSTRELEEGAPAEEEEREREEEPAKAPFLDPGGDGESIGTPRSKALQATDRRPVEPPGRASQSPEGSRSMSPASKTPSHANDDVDMSPYGHEVAHSQEDTGETAEGEPSAAMPDEAEFADASASTPEAQDEPPASAGSPSRLVEKEAMELPPPPSESPSPRSPALSRLRSPSWPCALSPAHENGSCSDVAAALPGAVSVPEECAAERSPVAREEELELEEEEEEEEGGCLLGGDEGCQHQQYPCDDEDEDSDSSEARVAAAAVAAVLNSPDGYLFHAEEVPEGEVSPHSPLLARKRLAKLGFRVAHNPGSWELGCDAEATGHGHDREQRMQRTRVRMAAESWLLGKENEDESPEDVVVATGKSQPSQQRASTMPTMQRLSSVDETNPADPAECVSPNWSDEIPASNAGLTSFGLPPRSPAWCRTCSGAESQRPRAHSRNNSNASLMSEADATALEAVAAAPRQFMARSAAYMVLGRENSDQPSPARSAASAPAVLLVQAPPPSPEVAQDAATATAGAAPAAEQGAETEAEASPGRSALRTRMRAGGNTVPLAAAPRLPVPAAERAVSFRSAPSSTGDDDPSTPLLARTPGSPARGPLSPTSREDWDVSSIPPEEGIIATPRQTPKCATLPPSTPGSTAGAIEALDASTAAADPSGGLLEAAGAQILAEASASLSQVGRRVLQGWAQELGTAWHSMCDQVGNATHSSLAYLVEQADITGRWAEERIEEECLKALQNAALTRELAKARILDISAPLRSNVLGSFKAMIVQSATSDPDMWECLKRCYKDALEHLLTDIEHELEANLEAALLKQASAHQKRGPEGTFPSSVYYGFRKFILYHYLPHDLSFFGKLKDPVYLGIMFLTLLPVHLLRVAFFCVLLVMLLFPGPPDEFQLINFILGFKGSQFLSSGLLMMGRGSMMYFICFSFNKADMATCVINDGPGSGDSLVLGAVDYLGSIVLPWVAFCWLPYSEKHVTRRYVGRRPSINSLEDLESAVMASSSGVVAGGPSSADFTSRVLKMKGGRLGQLLMYDVKCFALSLACLAILAAWTFRGDEASETEGGLLRWLWESAQFREDLFWVKVLYGLLSLPFLPFMVSLFLKVLTHCEWTGFNPDGACVEFVLEYDSRDRRRKSRGPRFSRTLLSPLGRALNNAVGRYARSRTGEASL